MKSNYPEGYYELDCVGKQLSNGKCLGYTRLDNDKFLDECLECEHFILNITKNTPTSISGK